MSKTYLAKFKSNYADEFNVSGVAVFSQTQVDIHNQCIEWLKQNPEFSIEWYFGANQPIVFDNVTELENAFEFTEITFDQMMFIMKDLKSPYCGFFFHLFEYMPFKYQQYLKYNENGAFNDE